ncbi:MAG: hypothetical protein ACKOPS_13270 [Cyanobium sp.]
MAPSAAGHYSLDVCSQAMGDRSLHQLALEETIRRFADLADLVA